VQEPTFFLVQNFAFLRNLKMVYNKLEGFFLHFAPKKKVREKALSSTFRLCDPKHN
jgi:hypothetical protein